MHQTLTVVCKNCNSVTQFIWCFQENVCLHSSTCKKCYDNFNLISPKQKTDQIITSFDFLPYSTRYYDGFYYEGDGNFKYFPLSRNSFTLPILFLTQHKHRDGLVSLSTVEKFVNDRFYYTFK